MSNSNARLNIDEGIRQVELQKAKEVHVCCPNSECSEWVILLPVNHKKGEHSPMELHLALSLDQLEAIQRKITTAFIEQAKLLESAEVSYRKLWSEYVGKNPSEPDNNLHPNYLRHPLK